MLNWGENCGGRIFRLNDTKSEGPGAAGKKQSSNGAFAAAGVFEDKGRISGRSVKNTGQPGRIEIEEVRVQVPSG